MCDGFEMAWVLPGDRRLRKGSIVPVGGFKATCPQPPVILFLLLRMTAGFLRGAHCLKFNPHHGDRYRVVIAQALLTDVFLCNHFDEY